MSKEWIVDGNVSGYLDENGKFIVCEEYGTDEQLGKYDIDVQNGNGYYNSDGQYIRFVNCD